MHEIQEKIIRIAKTQDISKLGYRKIGQLIGISHPQQIKHHLDQLIKKGYININKSTNLIDTVKKGDILTTHFTEIPLYGTANCGTATFIAEDKIEGYIKVSNNLLKKRDVIAVKAAGDSLNLANIHGNNIENGDYILIDTSNKSPHNGDYVLSIIDNCANIKKFIQKSSNQISLVSESTTKHELIFISPEDSYLIGGVVTQVIKT